jgi:hypothetical protein
MLKKLYRPPGPIRWTIFEKELVDEIIFLTIKPRNRLILELMARGGMSIGILHTWGQNLMDHPHIHCIVSGGGTLLQQKPLGLMPQRVLHPGPGDVGGVQREVP